jgi:ferredoxin-NADP reductase
MPSREGMTPLVVSEIVRETPRIVSIRLERPDGAPLPAWEPGAHIDVQLVTRHERQYSLCGDPADVTGYRIAVLREPRSRGGSHYVHSYLKVGSRVWVRPPRNLFRLGEAEHHLLLAAGIGITPILAMARHLQGLGADWRMAYLAREADDVAFRDELAALGDRVRVHVSSESGRLDLAGALRSLEPGTDVYACGPQRFVDALGAAEAELPAGCRLHLERFEPKKREFGPNEPFQVELARSGRTLEVPADRSLLGILQGAGVAAEGSCRRGVCGSCALTVLDGVPEHRDSLTTDPSSTTIYPCVSRALSPSLTLDV